MNKGREQPSRPRWWCHQLGVAASGCRIDGLAERSDPSGEMIVGRAHCSSSLARTSAVIAMS